MKRLKLIAKCQADQKDHMDNSSPIPRARLDADCCRQRGFTITEVAVVTVLLGILLSSILALVSHASRYLHDIRLTARSSQVLQQKMEDIRLLTWDSLTNYPSVWTNSESTYGTFVVRITTNRYSPASGATTVLQVTLSTTWTNFSTRQVATNRLTTLVTKGGLNQYIY